MKDKENNNDKPLLLTRVFSNGEKASVVYHPIWGSKPLKEKADEVKETKSHIEYIYYE